MQKTTTLKDFKVLVLKTILAIFVLSISFKGIGQDLRTTKFPSLAKPAQTGVKKVVVQQQSAQAALEAKQVAVKQQTKAQGAASLTGAKASSNKAATAAQKQSDNPAFVSSPNLMASPNKSTVACLFNGSLVAGDLTMPQRLFRPGTAGGTCATPQPFPGTFTAGLYFYDTYTFVNTTGAAACVTANLTTTDATNANIQHGAWLGSFNPANMATNYIADPYVSTGTPAAPAGLTFSFNLANGATVVFVVWSANPNTAPSGTASQYTLSIDGLPNLCPQPACVPSTAAVISAVSIPYQEGFDAVPIPPVPAGWASKNNSVPGLTDWFAGNATVFPSHSGASYIAANFNNTSGTNTISNWLIAPTTTLHNGDQLKFWTRTTTGAFPDRLQVRMSQSGTSINVGTTATDVGDFGDLLLDINPTYTATGYPIVWTQMTATVAGVPAAGISGRLAFRYFVENGGPGGANSDYMGIDDVQYIGAGSPSVCAGGTGSVKVDITGGSSPFTLVLNANPPGGAGGNFTINNYTSGTLIPVGPINATTTYTIVSVTASGSGGPCTGTGNSGSAVFNLTPASTSAVLSQVQIPGPATQLISEDFVIAPPASWAIQNNSAPGGLISWFQGNTTVFNAPFGAATSYLAANFNSTAGANTISNWAMPPSVLAKNGDVLSFWTRTTTGTFPDRLQVRMNTVDLAPIPAGSPTSVGNYTNLLLDINPTYTATGYPTAWTKFSITMSGLPAAGQNVRFAFRYFVENGGPAGANSDYIGIDSVRYTTFPLVNPTTCTGSTANLKVNITGGTSPYTVVIGATPAQAGFPMTVTNYISGSNIPVTPPVTTTYNLISVTSADGCLGTGNSGTPTITVSPTPVAGIQIVDQPTGPLCAGDPKLLTVTGAGGPTPFCNPTPITINSSVPATPSPSVITVTGLPTTGVTVTNVVINGFSHTWTGDVNIVLQHSGTNVILKGDSNADPSGGTTNATWTFTDAATASLPAGAAPTGTYKPTNRNGSPFAFLAPGPTVTGPTFPASPTLATFTGDMNGAWNLYVEDRVAGDQGSISGGYCITFNVPAAPPTGYTFLWSPATGLSSTTSNPVAASPMVTTTYTVMGTAPSGCQTTAQITITVLPLPAVTQNPTNVTACGGSTVTFTGAGSGSGATYSWQVSTTGAGGPWTTVTNGGIYSGATTPTLTVGPITPAMNGWRYRLVVSGTCPPAANSASALLTVITQPTITVSPAGPICGGVAGISGLALTASGASTYTWAPATGLYTNTTATTAYVAGSNANPVYAAPTVLTVYTVTGTAAATGCTNTATVIVKPTPPPPIVTPNPVAMCLGNPPVRLISSSAVPGTCTTSTGTISVPIPDNTANGIANTLNVTCVPANATITGVTVTFSVPNHTYVGDLIVNLRAPNGTIINLDKYMSGSATQAGNYPNSGFVNANFGSAITSPALGSATSTPISGNWAADMINGTIPFAIQEINGFTSTATSWTPMLQGNGAWTLAMADGGPADIGTLTGWSIKIDYFVGVQTTAATWSPVGGLFNDAAGTIAYTGTPRDTVWTQPTPAGVYNYNVTVNGIVPPAIFSNPTAIPIQDNIDNQSTVVVANLPTTGVTVKAVTLTGFSHTWTGDVNVVLQNPAGTQNVILKGDSQADPNGATTGANIVFTDAATASLPAGAITSGTYKPTNRNGATFAFLPPGPTVTGPTFPASPTLSTFTGNMNGTWKLFVEDRVGGDVGSISGGFSIEFNDANPGCTSPARVVTVTVSNPIVVTLQPVNHTVCTNGSTSFTVAATGSGVTYQWQVSTDAGNTWTNITNNANYAGATTPTLTITNPPVAWNGYLYRALISGVAPCAAVPSNNVVLTVNPLPTITLTAAPYRNLLPGLQTTINANSSPVAATYQWFRNGVAVPPPAGTSGPGLTIGVDGIGTYSVRITDVNGCTNTSGTIVIGDSTSGRVFIYPNPTTGRFGVRYNPVHNGITPFGVVVRDALGKLVWNQQYTLGIPFAPMNVDLSNMASGVYWVEVVDIDNNRLAVGRVVVGH